MIAETYILHEGGLSAWIGGGFVFGMAFMFVLERFRRRWGK